MPVVEVFCPECGAKLKAPESAAGKKAKCKKCRNTFRVPGGSEGASESASGTNSTLQHPDEDKTELMMAEAVDELPSGPPTPAPAGSSPQKDLSSLPSADAFDFKKSERPGFGAARTASPPPAPPAAQPPLPPSAPPAVEIYSLDDDPLPAAIPPEAAKAAPAPAPQPSPGTPPPAKPLKENREEAKPKQKAKAASTENEPYNPFANFDAGIESSPAIKPLWETSDKQKKKAEEAEEPEGPRYRPPEPKRGMGMAILFTTVVGLIALGLGTAAVIMFMKNLQPPEPVKKEEKKEEEPPPGEPQPPDPKPKEMEPDPKPKPKDTVPGSGRLAFTLPNTRPFTIGALPPKLALTDKPSVARVIEAPLSNVKRIFPPPKPEIGDTCVLIQSAPGVAGVGEKLVLDTYGPAGNRVPTARIEYDGDGLVTPITDFATTPNGLYFLAASGGKLHVWSMLDNKKQADGISPYTEKPEHAKAGLAAAFLSSNPNQVVTVSTSGAMMLFDLTTSKPVPGSEFIPPHGVPGKVRLGQSVAKADGGDSIILAVGGVVYQVRARPGLEVVRKVDMGGDVGASLGVAASGTPGRLLYVFETYTTKEKAVMCLPLGDAAKPVYFRLPAEITEPRAAFWADSTLAGIATDGGVLWFLDDRETPFSPLVSTLAVANGQFLGDEKYFWYLLPSGKDPMKCVLSAVIPFNDIGEYQKHFPASRPLRALQIDEAGLKN